MYFHENKIPKSYNNIPNYDQFTHLSCAERYAKIVQAFRQSCEMDLVVAEVSNQEKEVKSLMEDIDTPFDMLESSFVVEKEVIIKEEKKDDRVLDVKEDIITSEIVDQITAISLENDQNLFISNKERVYNWVNEKLNVKVESFFGTMVGNLTYEDMLTMNSVDFVFFPKIDGERVLIVVIEDNCFFLYRSGEVEYVGVTNTTDVILDAELKGNNLYLFDLLYKDKTSYINYPVLIRLGFLKRDFRNTRYICNRWVYLQQCFKATSLNENRIGEEGFVMYELSQIYTFGFNRYNFKWKKFRDSLDLLVKIESYKPILAGLYAYNKEIQSMVLVGKSLSGDLISYDGKIVEFNYDHGGFIRLRERKDKNVPNEIKIVNSIMDHVNVSEKDFFLWVRQGYSSYPIIKIPEILVKPKKNVVDRRKKKK